MAVTLRNDAKDEILRILNEQGYPSYARLLNKFNLFLTDNPEVVGYMLPGKAAIVINQNLTIEQVSVIVRHEILHEFLSHGPRGEKFDKEHPELLPDPQSSNIAADYEISNKGYTEKDKWDATHLKLNGTTLRGLVTEDEHPDWVNLTFEEMYEKILTELKDDKEKFKKVLEQLSKLSKQDLEDLDRELQKMEDQESEGGDNNTSNTESKYKKGNQKSSSSPSNKSDKQDDIQQQASELGDKLDDVKDDLKDLEQSKGKDVFDDSKEQKERSKLAKQIQEIKDAFNDLKEKEAILNDARRAKQKEKLAKAATKTERRNASPLNKFKLNLQRFIADQLEQIEDYSYTRVNPSYEDTEFIMPGRRNVDNKYIPVINVYLDTSGSFGDPAKTEGAFRAIDTLNTYVKNGDIKLNLFYFADQVASTQSAAGSGTYGQPILNHIQQTAPTNVIVITDSDITDCHSNVVVPGAVWMLFYDDKSQNLIEHLRGKKETKYYMMDY